MAVLDSLTGGYASSARDAAEAAQLFSGRITAASLATRFFGTTLNSVATLTGIGIIVTASIVIFTNWDKILEIFGLLPSKMEKAAAEAERMAEASKTQLDNYESLELLFTEGGLSGENFQKTREALANQAVIDAQNALDLYVEANVSLQEVRKATIERAKELGSTAPTQLIEDYNKVNEEEIRLLGILQQAQQKSIEVNKEGEEKAKEAATNKVLQVRDAEEAITLETKTQQDLRVENEAEAIATSQNLAEDDAKFREDLRKRTIVGEKLVAETRKQIQAQNLASVKNGIGILKQLAGDNEAIQAGLIIADAAVGIAQVITSTQAANAAITAQAGTLAFGTAGGSLVAGAGLIAANNIQAGISIGGIVLASATSLAQLGKGGTVPSAAPPTSSGPPTFNGGEGVIEDAPQFSIAGNTESQLGATISAALGNTPVKAYVVASDVTTQQQLERAALGQATITKI
jgi:hypothetical protein